MNLGAPLEVNLEHGARVAIVKAVKTNSLDDSTFRVAQKHIYELMKKDSFEKWRKLPEFKKALKEASKNRGPSSRSHERLSMHVPARDGEVV